jgi:hypothetical protein
MPGDRIQIELVVDEALHGPGQRAEDARYLREELAQLDLERTDTPAADAAPPGARGAGAVEAGSIVVAMAAARPTLAALLGLVQDWLARRQSGTVKITIDDDEIELTFASRASQKKALDAFLDRHAK